MLDQPTKAIEQATKEMLEQMKKKMEQMEKENLELKTALEDKQKATKQHAQVIG